MGEGEKTTTKYRAIRRTGKREIKTPRADGRSVVFVCREVLKEIWIHTDEVGHTGVITWVTRTGKEIRRTLVYTWFPQGIYRIKFSEPGDDTDPYFASITGSENVDTVIVDRLKKLTADKEFYLWQFIVEDDAPTDQMVECLQRSAAGKEITVRVTYTSYGGDGKGEKVPERPLSDDYLAALGHEMVARIYILMLEHFAGIAIDERVALGGIDRKEYAAIVKLKTKTPGMGPRTIARVVTQAAYEYGKINGDSWECLTLMTETLLAQRKRQNALAVMNQLEIARGLIRLPGGKLMEDHGIKHRGNSVLLLYDKYGSAIPAYIGYMDLQYRNIDLEKIPHITINVSDPGLADFLKLMEQTFSFPTRETYFFLAGINKFYVFIVHEIYRIYDGEIRKKVMEMLPMAIGFFVVHAVLGTMAERGNPYAAAILVMAKALGWIIGFDSSIASMRKMQEAGRHFAQLEMIHRNAPKEKPKVHFTKLSQYHLEMGARALIDVIAEVCAMGVFIAGGVLGSKGVGAIGKYVRSNRNNAKVEVHIENDKITKVRAIQETTTIKVQIESPSIKYGAERITPTGQKLRAVRDVTPIEEAGVNLGRAQRSQTPKPTKITKLDDYQDYKSVDPHGRPASSREVTGLPEHHLKYAIEIVKDQGVMPLFRVSNPRSIQYILNGHPPKGKDLIALNTDKVTGKLTARTWKQRRIARAKGYYILEKDGFAYNKAKQKLTDPEGNPVRFDMKQRGEYGELTNRPGQVMDKATRKAVVSDYDLQDVIDPSALGRNLAGVPRSVSGDVVSPAVRKFTNAFNQKVRNAPEASQGGLNYSGDRIVHGADAQFIQYRYFRKNAFKGDAVGIMPDGRIVYFTESALAQFYKAIGRSRLGIPQGKRSQPYRPD
jgi:hypothetical protein